MSGQRAPLLEVHGLAVSFKTPEGLLRVVDGISFDIDKGECLAIVGESGCGKSVSAMAILGLLNRKRAVVEGSVKIEGRELVGLSESELRPIRGGKIGIIFQEPLSALNPVTSIGEQIAEVIVAHRGLKWPEAHRQAISYLDQVEIAQADRRAGQFPHQLSGGMRQRAMIAMALAGEPQLIIADEPTTALDVTIQAQVLDLLKRTAKERGASLMLITHDLGVVAETANRIAVMYAGQIVEYGPAAAVLRGPASPYARDLVQSIPSFSRRGKQLTAIAGNVPSPAEFPSGCRFHPRCQYAIKECADAVPALIELGEGRGVRCIRSADLDALTANAARKQGAK
jgi:oligopeptide/dipeptide ABC transporter ATP-binding protein